MKKLWKKLGFWRLTYFSSVCSRLNAIIMYHFCILNKEKRAGRMRIGEDPWWRDDQLCYSIFTWQAIVRRPKIPIDSRVITSVTLTQHLSKKEYRRNPSMNYAIDIRMNLRNCQSRNLHLQIDKIIPRIYTYIYIHTYKKICIYAIYILEIIFILEAVARVLPRTLKHTFRYNQHLTKLITSSTWIS